MNIRWIAFIAFSWFSIANGQQLKPPDWDRNLGQGPLQVSRDDQFTATLTNLSRNKTIVTICGHFSYEDDHCTERHKTRFMENLAGPLISPDHGLEPGESHTVGPKPWKGFLDRFIAMQDVEITGVVFSDGRIAGIDGEFCKARAFDGARAARMQLMEVRKLADERTSMQMEDAFVSVEPIVRGYDNLAVHIWLQHLVLDEDRNLRKDYKKQLDLAIERLSRF